MKKLVLLPLIVASTLSYGAAKLTCEQLTGWETAGYKVLMKYSAEVENVTPMTVKLNNLNLQYNIDGETLDDPSSWGMGSHSYDSITNTRRYNPRKYKDHSKFEILLDTRDSYGSVDLIIPTKNLNMKTNSQFKAYAIMTAISDHMGGTVQLDCKLERAEKDTFALTKVKVDKYLSDANNQLAEGILSYEEYKGITNMSELLSQTMTESSYRGLSNLTLSEVAKYNDASIKKSVDKIIKAMNFEYQPYFCESIVKDFSFSDEEIAECLAKTTGIIKAMMKDEGVQSLSMIKASGNEWGMWESIYLVGRNFDSEESIVIYFDLVHEI